LKMSAQEQRESQSASQAASAALSQLSNTTTTSTTSTTTSTSTKSDATHIARVCVLRVASLELLDEFSAIFHNENISNLSISPNISTLGAISVSNSIAAVKDSESLSSVAMPTSLSGPSASSLATAVGSTSAASAASSATAALQSSHGGPGGAVQGAVVEGGVMSVAFSLGKQRYAARIDGLHLSALSAATSVTLEFATAFPYLHSVKSPSDELRILLQATKSGATKKRGAKPNYVTVAYASVDLAELLQAPADGVVTLFRVIRADKRSVRARLRNTATTGAGAGGGASAAGGGGGQLSSTASLGGGGASASATAAAAASEVARAQSQAGASQAAASRPASDATPAPSSADIDLDDSDEEREINWTDVDGTAVGRDTGNKHDTLGAPVARLHLRIATVAAGNERADEFEDAADQLDEGGAVAAPASSRDDVLPEAIGADEDDQLVASLSLADRIRYRVENNTKGGEKGPGKFRKWATKLRKRPTVDEKRQSKEPAAWILSDDDGSDGAEDAPPRSAPLAIHAEPLGSAGGGESPVDQFDNALSDADDDSSGAYRRTLGGGVNAHLTNSGGNDDADDNDADDGIGAVAAIARVGKSDANAKRSSKSLMTAAKAAPALNLWKASERNSLALLNIGRRSASVVVELWRASPALADALPLIAYKDTTELTAVLAGAIDKRDETAQRVDQTRPLSVMIVGDDKDVSDVVRPFLEIAAKKRRTWQAVEFWLVPIGRQRELANQIASHDATYRALFFAPDWLEFFQPGTVRDAPMHAAIAARIAQYALEARATRAFQIAEALLTVNKAGGGEGNLQLTVPVLRQVSIGQRDSNETLPVRLDYWASSEKKRDKEEKKELKSFQFVAVQRLGSSQGDLLSLTVQKAGKKGGLARKMITGGKDADALLTANVSKALVASEKEPFVVTIDDVEWPNVKFASLDPRWAGHVKQLAIQAFE
jgi:hypothetical protein